MDDTIYRQAALDVLRTCYDTEIKQYSDGSEWINYEDAVEGMKTLPPAEPVIIRCKDCKWWDREAEDSPFGYCHACKHSHYSRHWEINIRRTYEEDFFCADADPKEEEEEDATD